MTDTKCEDKGLKGGKCNRTACPNRPAECWSSVERAYYCVPCAARINVFCPHGVPRIEIPPAAKEPRVGDALWDECQASNKAEAAAHLAAKEPGVRPPMLRLGNHMMRDRIAREQYGHETYYLCAEVDAQLAALTEERDELAKLADEHDADFAALDARWRTEIDKLTAELAKASACIKTARIELGGIGPESSKEFHRIGIESAMSILDALLASKAGEK